MTVLLSFEEKTDDARACAQSGHCPIIPVNVEDAAVVPTRSSKSQLEFINKQ